VRRVAAVECRSVAAFFVDDQTLRRMRGEKYRARRIVRRLTIE
jgi:hypothetical protein